MKFSFWPREIYKTSSSINGEIKVVEQFGRNSMRVGGLEQSGPMVKSIWAKTLRKVTKPSRVLVLGLGGGTVVRLVNKKWPRAKIVGLEIDGKIIKVAKRFFGLSEVENLKVIKANALGYFRVLAGGYKKFDLILVDLYLGDKFPKEAQDEKFFKSLEKILKKEGEVVFNRLKTDETEEFEKALKASFLRVKKIKTAANDFFLVRV